MVTDLGRRNISQMCGDMGVENIIVAANISKKEKYNDESEGMAEIPALRYVSDAYCWR